MIRIYKSILLFPLIFLVSACKTIQTPSQPLPADQTATDSQAEDFYTVYFTDPESPTAGTYQGGPDNALADAIQNARISVDAAVYHLNLWSIRDALIDAHEKGVTVRVVVESDNLDEVEIQQVRDSGIVVLGDRRESLMHNKFVIIDGIEVWTGSMNFTVTGAYLNDNNLIRIRSTRLAENFTTEFEEMFLHDMFGNHTVANTPYPSLTINGTQIETYFSPDDSTADAIISYIEQAEESIYFLAYSFTSDEIAEAMLERYSHGVKVVGVFEEGQYYANAGTEYDRLVASGLDVHMDGNERNMHHKVIIIDEEIVILGSYNFSRSAEENNDENTLFIHNADIADQFFDEFQRIYSIAPGD
jgi:phosphatidylserine/phosphatidylglycerophosphate/cardiolipin synthase-like enzyme